MSGQSANLLAKLKFLIRALIFVLLALIATFAAIGNTERIRLSLLGYESPELSVFWWLFIVLLVGLILGRFTRVLPNRNARHRKASRDRQET